MQGASTKRFYLRHRPRWFWFWFNAITAATFEKVKDALPSMESQFLKKPLQLVGSFKTDKDTFSASAKFKLTMTTYLPSANVPVLVRDVEFVIVDEEMDLMLLGRPFLKAIGFHLKDHLLRVHSVLHYNNLAKIYKEQLKFAAATYKGLSYISSNDDPIELSECLAAVIGIYSDESINAAFENVFKKAK